jgi:hypothetical protein
MLKPFAASVAAAGLLLPATVWSATYADSIVSYAPGTGFATDFSTGQGLTNVAGALGEPSRSTPGAFGGPVDPFNPPYLKEQVVSVGAGGSLTVGFSAPILNSSANKFGLDFTIFGNAGFVVTNGNFSGGGVTDGTLFGANSGTATISVSADGVTYLALNPARASAVDTLFPTDGSGSFDLAVDPTLTAADFAGRNLAGIRELYQGAAGGTSFDLAWAQDANGESVLLPEVRFIRISVLEGAAEIDGIAGISSVPEPATWVLLSFGLAAVLPCAAARSAGYARRRTGRA